MMIKKQLSVLAGSVLLAGAANAAITAGTVGGFTTVGTESSAILVLGSAAGSYVFDTGLTASQLASGQGFSIDISASFGDLGAIETYALFGTLGGNSNAYAPGTGQYVDLNGGVVYSSSAANPDQVVNNLDVARSELNIYINNASAGGFFAAGTLGDFQAQGVAASGLTTGFMNLAAEVTSLFAQTHTDFAGGTGTSLVDILNPAGAGGVQVDGSIGSATAVPVPAAAWLFGSALLGLGVVRRKA